MNSEMKNNHHPTQYTMKDLFPALNPMSYLISLHQSKQDEEEEFKEHRAQDSKSATMGGMNSSSTDFVHHTMEDLCDVHDPMSFFNRSQQQNSLVSPLHQSKQDEEEEFKEENRDSDSDTASLHHLNHHHHTMEDLFEALDQSFTLQRGPRYNAYAETRRELRLQMKHQPQPQQEVQQSTKQQQQQEEEELNIVTNFTLERRPRYKAYAETRRELKLQMKEKWCHHMRKFEPLKKKSMSANCVCCFGKKSMSACL